MNRQVPVLANPTRIRYGVLGFACSLAMITYLDRACFALAEEYFVHDWDANAIANFFWAKSAFNLAYALFEIPTGWLGDIFGPRKTLLRIVLWWSFFTALTGLVGMQVGGWVFGGLALMVVVRFLFGVGEAGAFPNITRALHNWFPVTERGMSQGFVWMSGRLAGGVTPSVWWLLVDYLEIPWRGVFLIFGILGVVWCVAFALWFRNRPAEHPGTNAAEVDLIAGRRIVNKEKQLGGHADTALLPDAAPAEPPAPDETNPPEEAGHAGVPWGKLLASTNLWALCLMYFCSSYAWYFNINEVPKLFEIEYDVSAKSLLGAVYKGGPLWFGAVACLVGGWLTDRFIRRTGNLRWGRRWYGIVGHGICAFCYLACMLAPNAFVFFLFISLAGFFNDLTMGSAWSVCQDIGRRYAAIVAGCMNTIGNLGGFFGTTVSGWILSSRLESYAKLHGTTVARLTHPEKAVALWPGYQLNLLIFFGIYLIAVALWFRVDATESVVPDHA